MNPKEAGFLLLSSKLGNPERKTLSTAQLRTLAQRVQGMARPIEDRELEISDLISLGYGSEMARRILDLLEETELLKHYLARGTKLGCVPLSRLNSLYPKALKEKLGPECPGCLWAKGDLSILDTRKIALVGSRDIRQENWEFAREVGRQAALQGYTLVSGNARGADKAAQNACLRAGGRVISVVADSLEKQTPPDRVLYLSEEGFDEEFSAQRALSRNRCIHGLAEKTFVAQCACQQGGTWDGTEKNLQHQWSPVFGFRDGSRAMVLLEQMGAVLVGPDELDHFDMLQSGQTGFLD